MTTTDQRPVLFTGATGGQGGSAAIAALKNGVVVRALARNPDSDAARAGCGWRGTGQGRLL